jgi:transcriptional regulator with XRE-family HTH domain
VPTLLDGLVEGGAAIMHSEIRSGGDIGRAIRSIRTAQGLSQVDAAELAGIDAKYLSKIEGGRTVSLLEHELRILRRLGARITVTFDDVGDEDEDEDEDEDDHDQDEEHEQEAGGDG